MTNEDSIKFLQEVTRFYQETYNAEFVFCFDNSGPGRFLNTKGCNVSNKGLQFAQIFRKTERSEDTIAEEGVITESQDGKTWVLISKGEDGEFKSQIIMRKSM